MRERRCFITCTQQWQLYEEQKQKNIAYVCIGPITGKTLKNYKIRPTLICNKYTIDNLLKEIVKFNKKWTDFLLIKK